MKLGLAREKLGGTAGATAPAGLAERVRTVDGQMEIASPPGGPTVVTVELPSHASQSGRPRPRTVRHRRPGRAARNQRLPSGVGW